MCQNRAEAFQKEREQLNDIVMKYAGRNIKRFYSLDHQTYQEGALSVGNKELLGLVASFVLRCDDCITYHVMRCHEEGVSGAELEETLAIGVIVGGSITVPHLRRALKLWDELECKKATEEAEE